MGPRGVSWVHVGCHGSTWGVMGHVGCHGTTWGVMGPRGVSWVHVGCHGSRGVSWDHVGCHGDHVEHINSPAVTSGWLSRYPTDTGRGHPHRKVVGEGGDIDPFMDMLFLNWNM
ncbi:hypothetical protein Pcinc_019224 [Petrolisthes cinctipes]|uniref:Uncharacterized protein n=1 Tax=Petrolisthes cinctipes TaxID=88211 RepID=A0AAE1KLH9_PETCI|nr:hypothetical protein Pcinc_019224 [Petrolisthes cinctipes]